MILPRATYEGVELLSNSFQGSPLIHAFDARLGISLLVLLGLLRANQALFVQGGFEPLKLRPGHLEVGV